MSTAHDLTHGRRAATATRRGVRDYNMDAAALFQASTGVAVAAIVDGIGNDPGGAATMRLLAESAVRVGATKGALAGVLAAAALVEDPGINPHMPDGVIVLALAVPGRPTHLAWVGDSHAYSWDGTRLHLRTDPHTMGAYLRGNGVADLAPLHDAWVRVTLSSATVTNVAVSSVPPDELVLLVSDGLDSVPHDELEALVREHQDDPNALADAIVAAARETEDGYRDDATALVLTTR
ncbi:SpoIIE family protein phosphatase [Kutzneria sp. 744]|uniref:SpoIIE family protein phosphatase n=1 Tax=Kutzneria sp. (strain 744) TaxID=345341 RepID=UPI0004B37B6C|nr:SpoIIE family protein phosphatase [Kutzneria sp. 744]